MAKLLNIKNLLFRSKYKVKAIRLSAIIIALNLICTFVNAQNNLVPNGSFENYSTCPTSGLQELDKAIPWFQPNDPVTSPGGSSDFFHFCTGYNCITFKQCPLSGQGMAALSLFTFPTLYNTDYYREYMEVALTDSLISGKNYCIKFYVNILNNSCYPLKQIQAVLTNDSLIYYDPNLGFIPGVTVVLEADSIITDSVNWTEISTIYQAYGGEKFITIGNFNEGDSVDYIDICPALMGDSYNGFYLFDDVSVYQQPDVFAGNDTIIPPGDSTQLGVTGRSDIIYSWSPATGLNNPNIANPMATPGASTSYTLTVTDTNQLACNSVLTDTILVQVGFIGIDELQNSNFGLHVYPNPFSEIITFKTDVNDSYEIRIFDIIGKQVKNILFEGNQYVLKNIEWNGGIYFYEMKNKNGERIRGRFVKK
jgi:Secretion system C-terminal sorting domain